MAKKVIQRPLRDPDHLSKHGAPYWFNPEWVRATSAVATSFGKIAAVKEKSGTVSLYIKSKSDNYYTSKALSNESFNSGTKITPLT